MTINFLKAAAKIGLPIAFGLFTLPAFGMPVDFTTTGTFTCGVTSIGCTTLDGGTVLRVSNDGNSLGITAVGYTNSNITPTTDDVNAITLNTAATGRPAPAFGVNTTGITFTLNITQTSPGPFAGTLAGSFSGLIDASSSSTVIKFAPGQTSLTLGGSVVYSLDQNTWTINSPGFSHITGTTETVDVSGTVTPEPTFMMLTGLGFAGLAFVAYRRKREV